MEEKEIWKDVVGFEGLYKVNQWGDIWSEYTHKKLKWSYHKDGYKIYNLRKDHKAYLMTAHRAVAEAFIPNPDNLPLINHKDENKENCYYKNLEWCTPKYNANYGDRNKKVSEKAHKKKVLQFTLTGEFIKEWDSLCEIERHTGFPRTNISACCRGKHKSTYGFIWKFKI